MVSIDGNTAGNVTVALYVTAVRQTPHLLIIISYILSFSI